MFLSQFFTTVGMDEQPIEYFFGPLHLLYLLLFITSFILLFMLMRKLQKNHQKLVINIALILILVLKYATEVLFIYEYNNVPYSSYPHPFWDVNTFFSFQLCGVMNIVLPITIWFNIKPLKPFVYLTSILGGLAVVFYPVTVLYGDPFVITLPMLRSSVVHFFLVFIPLWMIYQKDIKLKSKHALDIAIGLVSIAVWAMIGNLFIDSQANNMYLMSNPFLNGPIPVMNAIGNGYHVILLTILVSIGYFLTYKTAKQFEKKSE